MRRALVAAWTVASIAAVLSGGFHVSVSAQSKPRARDLGVPFDGTPGALNAITDVAGVEVGVTTLIAGEGALKVGAGAGGPGGPARLARGNAS